jgi:hypothetical protein
MNVNSETAKITISSNVDYLAEISASGSVTSSVTIARTAFVSKNGSDSTGLIERLDKPFLTIAAAQAALVSAVGTYYTNSTSGLWTSVPSAADRLCIKVFSGNYQETITLSQYFIDYDLTDASISPSVATAVTDNGVACNCIIFGSSIINGTVFLLNAGSNLRVDADTINGNGFFGVLGFAGFVIVNAKTITNNTNSAVATVSNGNGKVIINNARIINTGTDVCVDGGATGGTAINNCTLLASGSYSTRAGGGGAGEIYVYGACQANKPAGIGAILKISSIIVDSGVF